MKTIFFKISFIFLLLSLMGVGCKKEMSKSFLSDDIGDLISVFELKHGDSKIIAYGEEKIELSVTDIKDNVSINCSLADFSNNKEGPLGIRIYSYLQENNRNTIVKVESKPCGALLYKNNGNDIQDITDLINDLKSAPANSKNNTYFTDAFINLFGEGSPIENTSFRIFMAKAFPTNYDQPNANIDDYKFIFIITRKK